MLRMRYIFLRPILFQGFARIGALLFHYIFGFPGKETFPALIPSLGSDVNTVVGVGDDVEVVFDNENRVSFLHEPIENGEKFLDIREMKSGRGFIEDVNGFGSRSLGEIECELDPLCFPARERRSGLPEFYILEPDIVEYFEHPSDAGKCGEKFECLLDGHSENFRNSFSFESNLKRFGIVSASSAGLTFYIDIWKEVHLDLLDSGSFACFASSSFGIEAEPSDPIPSFLGFKRCREHFADMGEHSRISGYI